MSGRCQSSEKVGWSIPPLSSEIRVPKSFAARVLESPAGRVGVHSVSAIPVVSPGGASSSTMQGGKRSSSLAALCLPRVAPGGGLCSSACAMGGWLCIASSRLISSTIAMGGDQGLRLRRVDASARARSNFCMRLRRDSALYQAAPLRDFPLSLGMVEAPGGVRIGGGRNCSSASPFSIFGGGRKCSSDRMSAAKGQCSSTLSIATIKHQTAMPAIAINAVLLVLCRLVPLPRARGLIN
jgi:hypothetical protein